MWQCRVIVIVILGFNETSSLVNDFYFHFSRHISITALLFKYVLSGSPRFINPKSPMMESPCLSPVEVDNPKSKYFSFFFLSFFVFFCFHVISEMFSIINLICFIGRVRQSPCRTRTSTPMRSYYFYYEARSCQFWIMAGFIF